MTGRDLISDALRRGDVARQEWLVERFQHLADKNSFSAFGLLRRFRPVLRLRWPSTVVVTRREDVLAVLDDPHTFPAGYSGRLPGPFVLGFDGAEHAEHRAELDAVLHPDDGEQLGKAAGEICDRRLASVAAGDTIDIGTELVHPVLDDVVLNYVGIPPVDAQVRWRWGRDIFQDIFLNLTDAAAVRVAGEAANAQLGGLITAQLAVRRTGGPSAPVDDLLGRMLARQRTSAHPLSDAEIVSTLIGVAVGWLWHTARTALIAVDELLDRPDAMAQARAAAGDPDQLWRVLLEVLRFRPVQFGAIRRCAADTVLAPGTSRATRVPAGATVVAGTHSAMWDETAIGCPHRFDTTRPATDYLVFGHGAHRCPGEPLAGAQICALVGACCCTSVAAVIPGTRSSSDPIS